MPSTRVEEDWITEGRYQKITYVLKDVKSNSYIRVRGTNTEELKPEPDPMGEDPWSDLWFYSNPVFLEMAE
jgi:hypothetical protein